MIVEHPPINAERLRRLLTELIDIYSPSGKEEAIVEYLLEYLLGLGLPVELQEVDENRRNLVVAPAGKEALCAFIGHLDTVSAYDLDDFASNEDGDMISGLGAADMKGGCAAMIEAFTCLWEGGQRDLPLTLALVVGEEEDGDGAEALLHDYYFPWAIIGEPSELRPCLEHYGYLEIQLQTRGKRLHASLAHLARNPVQDMLRVLLALTTHLDGHPGGVVYNLRDIFTSGGGFMVPDSCEAWLDVHLPPQAPTAEVITEIEDIVFQQKDADSGLDISLRFDSVHHGYALPEKGRLVQALQNVYGDMGRDWRPNAFPSHSDANQLFSTGVRPIVLGPGRLESAHCPDEWIDFPEVMSAAEIYYRTALRLKTG